MAVYKVPQDVEADDKLLGPFSFRQFIYLVAVALSGVAAWGLGNLLLPLAIIPVPIMIVFLVLALPLRKDQPMEIYAAAIVSFLLKPRRRLWQPDGIISLIEISSPSGDNSILGKGLSEAEASERFAYLSQLVDSQGWAIRGVSEAGSRLQEDTILESQSAEDILDESNHISQSLVNRLAETNQRRRQDLLQKFSPGGQSPSNSISVDTPSSPSTTPPALNQVVNDPAPPVVPSSGSHVSQAQSQSQIDNSHTPVSHSSHGASDDTASDPVINYNPYPSVMRQAVIKPVSEQAKPDPAPNLPQPVPDPPEPRKDTPSTDIINLASNSDLSVETIAREAKRIKEKQQSEEIVLKLH